MTVLGIEYPHIIILKTIYKEFKSTMSLIVKTTNSLTSVSMGMDVCVCCLYFEVKYLDQFRI